MRSVQVLLSNDPAIESFAADRKVYQSSVISRFNLIQVNLSKPLIAFTRVGAALLKIVSMIDSVAGGINSPGICTAKDHREQ